MNYGLTDSTVQKMIHVLDQYPEVTKATIYGSRAMGNYKPGSDIDLTLHGEALSSDLLAKIASQLDDLLLPYTIDLSRYEEIDNADLKDHIQRVGKVFFEFSALEI